MISRPRLLLLSLGFFPLAATAGTLASSRAPAFAACEQNSQSGYEWDECRENAFVELAEATEKTLPADSYRCWAVARAEACGDYAARPEFAGAFVGQRWRECQIHYELRLQADRSVGEKSIGVEPPLGLPKLERLLDSLHGSDVNPCDAAAGA